jgi:hypothetical protein
MPRRRPGFRRLRVINLYDLMDSAYGGLEIKAKGHGLDRVPIIDAHPRNVGARRGPALQRAQAPSRRSMAGSDQLDMRRFVPFVIGHALLDLKPIYADAWLGSPALVRGQTLLDPKT